ncbi:MAG TPA: hypothetical protein VJK51_01530 [Candidatus Nanoarchaeia archaeon]|nr:hypothetical protein [Candidatus Nanoarchaeia archaeon]
MARFSNTSQLAKKLYLEFIVPHLLKKETEEFPLNTQQPEREELSYGFSIQNGTREREIGILYRGSTPTGLRYLFSPSKEIGTMTKEQITNLKKIKIINYSKQSL